MITVTYTIPNISCMHCIRTIKSELMDIEGVQNVEGDLENKKVTIDYSDPADEEKLRSLLSEIHYPPK